MASPSGIRAGLAFIELYADDNKLSRGLRAASAKLKAFGAGLSNMGLRLSVAGAGLLAPLLAGVKSFVQTGDQLDKMSKRTGTSVESLSEFAYAAKLSGAELTDVETGLRRMQRTIGDAVGGSRTAAEALAKLGLSAEQLVQLAPEDQFQLIGKRLNEIADPTLRAASAMEIFGRSGAGLLPMMRNLPELRAEAKRLGLTFTGDEAKAAATLNDAFDRLWATLKRGLVAVGGALAPLLTEWADKLSVAAVGVRDWLSQNSGLVSSLFKIALGVLAAGAALSALGTIVSALGAAFGVLATVISGTLAFILSPIGLATAAVAGLGAYILFATETGGRALSWLGERFDELKSFALTAFQGIRDALAAGDISLAAKVLWLSLQIAWRAGIAALKGWWLEFKGWFLKKTDDIFYGAVALIADAWFGLRKMWLSTVNYWTDILSKFASFFIRTWNDLNGWAAKQWTKVLSVIDPTINVEAVNKRIDQDTRRRNEDVSKQTMDVRLRHERELADLEQNRTQYMAAVAEAADRDDRTRRTRAAAETAESETALAQARKEFDDAVAEAASKRADLTAKTTGAETPGAISEDWTDRFDEAETATQTAVKRVGEFRQMDLSRISLEALGQGKGEEQRVTDPQLKTTNVLLSTLVKQGSEGRVAVAS